MLTSQSAKESGAVDPKAQITADEAKGKEPRQKEGTATPKKKVTSQMLLNKFQRDKKEDSTGKNLHDDMKGIGSVLSLCTVGKKG